MIYGDRRLKRNQRRKRVGTSLARFDRSPGRTAHSTRNAPTALAGLPRAGCMRACRLRTRTVSSVTRRRASSGRLARRPTFRKMTCGFAMGQPRAGSLCSRSRSSIRALKKESEQIARPLRCRCVWCQSPAMTFLSVLQRGAAFLERPTVWRLLQLRVYSGERVRPSARPSLLCTSRPTRSMFEGISFFGGAFFATFAFALTLRAWQHRSVWFSQARSLASSVAAGAGVSPGVVVAVSSIFVITHSPLRISVIAMRGKIESNAD